MVEGERLSLRRTGTGGVANVRPLQHVRGQRPGLGFEVDLVAFATFALGFGIDASFGLRAARDV